MLLHNFAEQGTFFTRIRKSDWIYIASGLVLEGVLIGADKSIHSSFKPSEKNKSLIHDISPKVSFLGGAGVGYILGATGIYGLLFKDHRMTQNTLLASQAYITSGVWVQLLKFTAARERPYRWEEHPEDPTIHWYGPSRIFNHSASSDLPLSSFSSFPSGHTASAFSIATVFAMQYSEYPVVPIVAYSLAGLVGLSRMTENKHWSSDVFAGACLGYLCGRQVVHHYRKLTGQLTSSRHWKKNVSFSFAILPQDGSWSENFQLRYSY